MRHAIGACAALAAGLLSSALVVQGQQRGRVEDLAAGQFLVASRKLPDPNFAEAVVLLIQYDDRASVGLIVNRPSKTPLSRLFQDIEAARERTDPVYRGGPVAPFGAMALLRTRSKPEGAQHVFADVYRSADKDVLEKAIADGTGPDAFRVYAGYAGWARHQLEREVRMGAWHIFPGRADTVFDPKPEEIWPRLIRRTELQIAWSAPDPIPLANTRGRVPSKQPSR